MSTVTLEGVSWMFFIHRLNDGRRDGGISEGNVTFHICSAGMVPLSRNDPTCSGIRGYV